MDTLDMKTPDLTEGNIDKIATLFPEVITEKEGEDGAIVRAVDFDLLRQALSRVLADDDTERYRLDWPGKKRALLKANTPITKTLRSVREESVDFDTTENLFIEGDNFEALKILQESYLGKVKMIYIDPPYNTGKDFVYSDKHTMDEEEYTELTGAEDEEGNKMFKENTRTNPRFHSDWLSMMYERLIIARDLLRDDGVILISIDDNEVHNLRKVCDEIFGESNFVGNLAWESKTKSQNTETSYNKLQPKIEHILLYTKQSKRRFNLIRVGEKQYPEKDVEGSYRKYPLEVMNAEGMRGRITMIYEVEGVWPPEGKQWKLGKDTVSSYQDRDDVFVENGTVFLKMRPDDEKAELTQPFWGFLSKEIGTAESAKKELTELMGKHGFETVKPIALLQMLIFHATDKSDYILDFFSGSATTAHAVMQQNAEDGGNRKFIMVQLPEETPEGSEARRAGYETIAQLGRERIRRASVKIRKDYTEKLQEREKQGLPLLDTGFRAYRVDETNMKDVYYHPTEVKPESLLDLVGNIKEDRTPEDLLTQVMLDLGLTLDLPIETREMSGNKVFVVAGSALVACFDTALNDGVVDAIAELVPLKLVVRDATFGTGPDRDQKRTNLATRMKRLSPNTEITVL